jgi:uncharacterized protein YerC
MPSPVSSVMFRFPTASLSKLRDIFLSEEEGLNILQFLTAFCKLMQIDSMTDLRKILPEIMDFFDLVDINGDGGVDFSEFVMFVIDEV